MPLLDAADGRPLRIGSGESKHCSSAAGATQQSFLLSHEFRGDKNLKPYRDPFSYLLRYGEVFDSTSCRFEASSRTFWEGMTGILGKVCGKEEPVDPLNSCRRPIDSSRLHSAALGCTVASEEMEQKQVVFWMGFI